MGLFQGKVGSTLVVLFCIFSVHAEALSSNESSDTDSKRQPNIVMLFVDDLGYGDVGFNGHPTSRTPNLDKLAYHGKILTSWYSGSSVCSASRSALLTGRQFTRTGVPGVFGPLVKGGLPLNETTVANQVKKAGYATAICGKWHLGQRSMFLPGNRGFDEYLGIPYSDDMGGGRATACPGLNQNQSSIEVRQEENEELRRSYANYHRNLLTDQSLSYNEYEFTYEVGANFSDNYEAHNGDEMLYSQMSDNDFADNGEDMPYEIVTNWSEHDFSGAGTIRGNYVHAKTSDPAAMYLPLVYQHHSTPDGSLNTSVIEQPVDFTHLAEKYNDFITGFIKRNVNKPFFLYVPFSHVHTTNPLQPEEQYAGCAWKKSTKRGSFGDALAEVDWIVGNIVETLKDNALHENTLIIFTGDNGPWMVKKKSGGSTGVFNGRASGYWNVGKGSLWEGGIREPAFAYWPGKIESHSRSDEVVSSLDLLPTVSSLVGVPLPKGVVLDGKDMSDVLFNGGKSKHDVLFFYSHSKHICSHWKGPSAARYGDFKVHFETTPGLGGCKGCGHKCYCNNPLKNDCKPLIFNVNEDPSEAYPLRNDSLTKEIVSLLRDEIKNFTWGKQIIPRDGPGEGPGRYGVCCDREKNCDCNGRLPKKP